MATRRNSIPYPGAGGGRPRGNAARMGTGTKVSVETGGSPDTFTGRVPGAMKGIVGGKGTLTTNSRPVNGSGGPKGIDRRLRG